MSLENCPECGKLFVKSMHDVCAACLLKEEEDFQKVREFLKEKRGATLDEVHVATGVDRAKILKFLHQRRIEGANVTWECGMCKKPITAGKLCEECAAKLSSHFTIKPQEEKSQPLVQSKMRERMYIVDRIKK